MEDKSVRYIVYIIISVILLIIILSVFFIITKIKRDNKPEVTTTEANHNYSYISCMREYQDEYNKKETITITYDYGTLDTFEILYEYNYIYPLDVDKIRSELSTIYNKERTILDEGIRGSYTPVEGGGETDLIYDLKDQDVRIYVNSKFLNNNMYMSQNELINYLHKNKNYSCKLKLD